MTTVTGFFFSRQSFQNHDEVLEAKEAAAVDGGVEDRRRGHLRMSLRRRRRGCRQVHM